MIESANNLFNRIVDKFGDSSNSLLLNGKTSSGYLPSQPGLIESQDAMSLSLRTASSDSKGTLTGVGFFLGGAGLILFLLDGLFGKSPGFDWVLMLLSFLMVLAPIIWEVSRPPHLPIIFNRRTQEIYYDMTGQLYHATWDGIEAVAYEYKMVNQYSGSIVHGNLEIILQKFGDPENRIAVNLSGVPAGKRLPTLVGIWEYLRCFMTIGPWFDETGKKTKSKTPFIEKSLRSGGVSFLDQLRQGRKLPNRERQEGKGISGGAFFYWVDSYFFFPMALGMECVQRIDRLRSKRHWPEVVQERLDPNGPTTRLIDIEESYVEQKQKERDELHERMRRVLPK
ncbi:DUF6708 domain-containing protein [Marinobacter sediminicola]|uniref:DUF6708 domain-containing protein n=1 Tax=Marinobacter sediminicola TaxID=3072994 RepID=UPI002811B773|nr:DUF6708 domain-containing protein [Marinobacter sp. F26243]